jgi:hypothetical protein
VGGWLVVAGRVEVGTVVAMVAGFGKLNDLWGDLVLGRRVLGRTRKYRLFADALAQRVDGRRHLLNGTAGASGEAFPQLERPGERR